MNIADREMRRATMETAAQLPLLAEGGSLKLPEWSLQARKDGNYRAFKDGKYWGTTGCKTEREALNWLQTIVLQQEAEADGILDVRRVSALVVIARRKKAVEKQKLKGAKVIVSTLKAIEGHLKDLQLRHLTDEKMEEIGEAMKAEGYSREYFCNAARYLATAIRKYTKKTHGAVFLPYDPPPCPKGRTIVVTDAQRNRVKRWGLGTEAYDPKTGLWKPQKGLSDVERRDREVAYREFFLGMTFGSRPGCYAKLSWEENDEGGWIDLDRAIFHRVPSGTTTPGNKLQPSVDIAPDVIPELHRWKEADAGSPWVFRTLKGGPLSQRQQQKIFKDAMVALGMANVVGHVLRHSCISKMIDEGALPASISALCGLSIEMLFRRYGHFHNRAVQRLAHSITAKMMG